MVHSTHVSTSPHSSGSVKFFRESPPGSTRVSSVTLTAPLPNTVATKVSEKCKAASVSPVTFKVDEQETQIEQVMTLSVFIFHPTLLVFCHSTSSCREGDRLGINKKKRIVILSSSYNSPFTPSFSLFSLISLSLSPSPASSISFILKSPSP